MESGLPLQKLTQKQAQKLCLTAEAQEHMDIAMKAYEEKGIDAKGYLCDVTDEAQVADMIQDIEKKRWEPLIFW